MKKMFLFGAVVVLLIAAFIFLLNPAQKNGESYQCPFCRPEVIATQTFYEGELVRATLNFRPLVTGHTLIMPKRHVVKLQDLTAVEFAAIGQTINKVQKAFEKAYGAYDYLLVLQDGENAGQTVYHLHFHMIPRAENNLLAKTIYWGVLLTRPFNHLWPVDWKSLEEQRLLLQEAMIGLQ